VDPTVARLRRDPVTELGDLELRCE
jgi:hypothetical protein